MTSKLLKLNILQWNAQSIKPKLVSFSEILRQEKVHIAVLSETWLEPECDFKVNGYCVYRADRDDSYGGVAILVHKSVKAQQKFFQIHNSGIEIVCVKVFNCELFENIIAIYCPSRIVTTHQDWSNLLALWSTKTLILGDFNAHHVSWSYKTDLRGTLIHDSLLDSKFFALNDGIHTRVRLVDNYLQQSSPDISLVSIDIAHNFNWTVLNENLGSDHLLIKISTLTFSHLPSVTKRNFRKADWLSYKKYLEQRFCSFQLPCDLQEAYDSFLDILNDAANKFIPLVKLNQNPTSVFSPKPYWSAEISQAVAQRRLALSQFRRNPTPENLGILNDRIHFAQKLIRQAKGEGWQNFCTSIDHTTSAKEMWHKMRWLKGRRSPAHYVD